MKNGKVLIITGLLLIAAALSVTGYNLWDAKRADSAAQSVVEELRPEIGTDPIPPEGRPVYYGTDSGEPDAIEYPDYIVNPKRAMPQREIDGILYVGVLEIPSLELELPVAAECSEAVMENAPCRDYGTAYLENMVICAHNYDGHFGRIHNLCYGDEVRFTDVDGNVFCYRVTETEILKPTELNRLYGSGRVLTLYTCTVGGRSRVAVRCEKAE